MLLKSDNGATGLLHSSCAAKSFSQQRFLGAEPIPPDAPFRPMRNRCIGSQPPPAISFFLRPPALDRSSQPPARSTPAPRPLSPTQPIAKNLPAANETARSPHPRLRLA